MKKFETAPYWKGKDGSETLLTDMSEEQLQKAYEVVQERQMKSYSSLEFLIKLGESIATEAKSRKFALKDLDVNGPDNFRVRRFKELKAFIKTTINSIKRNNKKHEKAESVLQEA